MISQNLEIHQWKHRLLLIVAKDSTAFQKSNLLELFEKYPQEIKDRKLIVYRIISGYYKAKSKTKWLKSKGIFDAFISSNRPLNLYLIGLDGNIKLKSEALLKPSIIFDKLMPCQ